MKRLMMLGVLFIGLLTKANAGSLEVKWDLVAGATYRVYQSVDSGATWTKIGEGTALPLVLTLPDTGLVLVRVANVLNGVEQVRFTSGFFYNAMFEVRPTGLGMK